MKKDLLFVLIVNIWVVSCGHHSEHQTYESTIHLNDGEKWEINVEMVPPLNKGREILLTYINTGDNDHRKLADALATQNEVLISSCTMDGESHEALHEWLHPHLELVKTLGNTNSTDEAARLVEQLQRSYKEFDHYFALD